MFPTTTVGRSTGVVRARSERHPGTARADGRTGIARRLSVMIRQLDAAAVVLTTHDNPQSGKEQANSLAGSVRTGFEAVADDWAKSPSRAQVAAATTAPPLKGTPPVAQTPVDTVEDRAAVSPWMHLARRDMSAQIEQTLQSLPPREERVLRLRFGIGDDHPYTLDEIGQVLRVSRERVRQIQAAAIRRLQASHELDDYRSLGMGA